MVHKGEVQNILNTYFSSEDQSKDNENEKTAESKAYKNKVAMHKEMV